MDRRSFLKALPAAALVVVAAPVTLPASQAELTKGFPGLSKVEAECEAYMIQSNRVPPDSIKDDWLYEFYYADGHISSGLAEPMFPHLPRMPYCRHRKVRFARLWRGGWCYSADNYSASPLPLQAAIDKYLCLMK